MPLTQPAFDPDRQYQAATFFRAGGKIYERGAPFPIDKFPVRTARMLYDNRRITFADATPEETAETLAPVTLEESGGGWYQVGAPWLDEPEKIQGHDKALFRAAQLRDEGEPMVHHGVALVEGENGWYKINAEWLAEPESVHGKEAAHERATQLREEGPPAEDEESSDDADQSEGGTNASATEAALTDSANATARTGDENAEAATGASTADRRLPTRTQRIEALVDGNTVAQLREKADGIEGLKSDHNKADIAALIVDADRDLPKAEDGPA